jgi:hypothetical protein
MPTIMPTCHTNAKEKLLARESEEGRVPLLPSGACSLLDRTEPLKGGKEEH